MATYRAAPAAAIRLEPLDELTALFHRPSGVTHIVASPVPEILAALDEEALSAEALLARLAARYHLADADPFALAARLAELVEVGLVARA